MPRRWQLDKRRTPLNLKGIPHAEKVYQNSLCHPMMIGDLQIRRYQKC